MRAPRSRRGAVRLLPVALLLATPALGQAPAPPTGWLSDPKEPARGLLDALTSGKVHLDDRLRAEWAETTGRRSSTALTNRLRLGYETKPFHGLSGLFELESTATPDEDAYFVPQTGGGTPGRTPIADPPGTEVNQAFARLASRPLGGAGISLELRAGRQRIQLDDSRFIGNVGWRQLEQTYDSLSVRASRGEGASSLFYAYLWGVRRIFGPDGPNPSSESHLVNVSHRFRPELRVTPFVYLLDFGADDPANSVSSYGLRLSGEAGRADAKLRLAYDVTFARQEDAGENPVDFTAGFFAVEGRLARKGLGTLTVGYQLLGSDGGAFGFRFPLGTNHAFQGFADNFLTTPARGVQDLYLGVSGPLPGGVRGVAVYHRFWSDEGATDLGGEIDLVASRAITPLWSVLAKAAFYDGRGGEPETTRLWLQTELRF